MFELPRFVIKSGRVIVEQGEIREESYGKTLHVAPEYDHERRARHPEAGSKNPTRSAGETIPWMPIICTATN